jgi:hypothetical protein
VEDIEVCIGILIEPGENTSILFDLSDKALDEVPFTIEVFSIIALGNSPGTRKDDRIRSVLSHDMDGFIRVISFVSNDIL